MINLEICWKSTHGVIDDKNVFDELVIKFVNKLGLAFDNERQITQVSCMQSFIKLKINKIIGRLN